jgi:hypothetical protein
MGTPARFMEPKSVKSDQPTIKATSPQAASLGFLEFSNEGYLSVESQEKELKDAIRKAKRLC